MTAPSWLRRRFGRDPHEGPATALYAAAIEQARAPAFYEEVGVPDTVEGRYDLLAVQVFLILRRLRDEGEATKPLAQKLFDVMFRDMEANLRELGVGDLKVGKKVRELAEQFYGRSHAYGAAMGEGAPTHALTDALGRNVFGDAAAPGAEPLAGYVRRASAALRGQDAGSLTAGQVAFPSALDDPTILKNEVSHASP